MGKTPKRVAFFPQGSIISRNYIYQGLDHSGRWGAGEQWRHGACVYHDNGSGGWTSTQNVCDGDFDHYFAVNAGSRYGACKDCPGVQRSSRRQTCSLVFTQNFLHTNATVHYNHPNCRKHNTTDTITFDGNYNISAQPKLAGAALAIERSSGPRAAAALRGLRDDLSQREASAAAGRIDRHAVVVRHNPTLTNVNTSEVAVLGNGAFALSIDVTGLQTLNQTFSGVVNASSPFRCKCPAHAEVFFPLMTGEKTPFLHHLILKLHRFAKTGSGQTLGKHSKTVGVFLQEATGAGIRSSPPVRKTRVMSSAMPFYTVKTAIILPRQARGKHRQSTQKREIFLFCAGEPGSRADPFAPPQYGSFWDRWRVSSNRSATRESWCPTVVLSHSFMHTSDHFTKTGSGQAYGKSTRKRRAAVFSGTPQGQQLGVRCAR